MNATQLWETTMNPQTRKLIQVTLDDYVEADKRVKLLLGSETDNHKKNWINEHISFDEVDEFDLLEKK
jgi:topoisomerase-4 subunit B